MPSSIVLAAVFVLVVSVRDSPSGQHRSTRPHLSILLPQKRFQTATSATHAVPPQTASVQLSENANADVEKGRPSRSRGQDCPLASMPLRTRRVPRAGINTVHTP